ncbi:MAG: ApbE family lipoprotein [Firmicutes bacterium]|nr:ApbE family lipoprotein [Bacillota bacterium]
MRFKQRWKAFGVLLGIALVCLGCSFNSVSELKPYKETQFLMDTVIEITAYGPNAESAVKAAFAEFKRLHDITDHFSPDSQVSKINQQAGKEKVKADPDLIAMISRSNELSDRLDGVFDLSIGPLTSLWGIGHKSEFIPSRDEIQQVLPLVNYHQIEVDSTDQTIYLAQKGMLLDLGGIAKGYSTDKAIEILKNKGITSALVNAGGDVRVIGQRPDKKPWRIGVQDPRNSDKVIAKLSLTDWDTMETSGDYQRYFMKDQVRYSHILDPRTGMQPREIISVTTINSSSGDGDILGTAVFVLGIERGFELLKQFPGTEAIVVTKDGRLVVTPGLQGKVELAGQE